MAALYAWGANTHGQLGLGYVSEMVAKPLRVSDLPDALSESSIKRACGGGGHTFLLTAQGHLYGAGWNQSGQVGNGTQVRSVPNFELIRGLEGQHIVSVACGWTHSVALSSRGQVWVWGSNSHSQLGLPKNEVPFSCLPICLDICDIVSISAGLRHSAAVTKDGQVYTWGHGLRGQLGHINREGHIVKLQPSPRVVESLEGKVSKICCGQNTTFAITNDGLVYAWGDNKFGQLSHDPKNVAFFSCPLPIPQNYFAGERAIWLRSGWTHVAARVESGEIYTWGRSDYGQLGPCGIEDLLAQKIDKSSTEKVSFRHRYIPSVVPLDDIEDMALGSEHCLAFVRRKSGDDSDCSGGGGKSLLSWGWNEHGSCGDGKSENRMIPATIKFPGVVTMIGAGSGHSFALIKL